MSGAGLKRGRTEGLAPYTADRYAVRLGLHPAEVWDDWWDVASAPCANDRCGELVTDKRYCSRVCSQAARGRAYYARKVAA